MSQSAIGVQMADSERKTRDGPMSVEKRRRMVEWKAMRPERTVALVGLMGAGKSAIGRRLAARLDLPFVDADTEIEKAAGCTIEEIFAKYGEAEFRDGERRVIGRLLERPPIVLATGGGAFMDVRTRALLREHAITIWLRADLPILLERVARRGNRPLLKQGDPKEILERLIAVRYPVYAEADIAVDTHDAPADQTTLEVLNALHDHLSRSDTAGSAPDVGDTARETVHVELGERTYSIEIGAGLLDEAGEFCRPHMPSGKAIIITDDAVAPLYLERLSAAFQRAGLRVAHTSVPAGEASKDFAAFGGLMQRLLDLRPDRRTVLVALGGGVVGDLTGFAASVLLRGVDFVQVPTTLLAQVDSSVGGKTGINTTHGKNLIGTFHQPRLVLVDTTALYTLPRRELLAGYAEVVKYGLIDDPAFFAWLERHGAELIGGDAKARAYAVATSCRAKARVVARDERESGDARALLNLGHTFGHALEKETGFGGDLLHGEAVAIGMVMAFDLSVEMGLCPPDDARRVRQHLAEVGLPIQPRSITGDNLRSWDAARLLDHMRADKKAQDGNLTFVLARGIGQAFVARNVQPAPALDLLRRAVAA
jgi:shikimate kinase/3-dehydroquinate synthase